ncbi:MAG: class I SAM-dependent methyltransferase [Bacteriovoracaceae bacterium]
MRFFIGDREILFEEFEEVLPEEAKLLQQGLASKALLQVDQNSRLSLLSSFSGPVSLKPEAELSYHKKYFFKNSIYSQPLAKALGIKKGKPKPKVLDASAGTLKDSALIISMGCLVLAAERNPVAQALIFNALNRKEIPGLEFVPEDAGDLINERQDFDVIFFDPMYEQKNEKAAPRKQMRIFREVVSLDTDAKESAVLFRKTGKRLVLKRSSKGDPLLPNPDMSFGQKSTLYDVYLG